MLVQEKLLIPCFKKNLKILDYFEDIITEEMMGISKTKAYFFKQIIKDYNLDIRKTIVIDDALHALDSAKKAD